MKQKLSKEKIFPKKNISVALSLLLIIISRIKKKLIVLMG